MQADGVVTSWVTRIGYLIRGTTLSPLTRAVCDASGSTWGGRTCAEPRWSSDVTSPMFWPSDALGIGMAQVPRLAGMDEAADELTVYEFGALAGGTSRTTHPAASNDRRPPLPGSAVGRSRVLRLLASAPESSALRRAEALVHGDGQELARAAIALALPVGSRHPEPHLVGRRDRQVPQMVWFP